MFRSVAAWWLAVSLFCLAGCTSDPGTPEHWESTLQRARRPDDRVNLVEAMRKSGKMNETFLPFLHAQLASEQKPTVRSALIRAVQDLHHPSSVDPLIAALDPAASDMSAKLANKAAVSALGTIGDKRAVPALVPLLKAKDNYTCIEAMQVLSAMRAKEAVEPLVALASDDTVEPLLNKKAIEALGEIGDPKAAPVLVRMLTKERKGRSFYVESSYALYQLGQPAADALMPALEGTDPELLKWAKAQNINPASYAMKAATVLGDLRERRAVAPLVKQLAFTHSDPKIQALVRMQAADALGRMRAPEAVKPLSDLLVETDPTVRDSYVRALARIGSRDAIPALEKAAGTGDWDSREIAARGLVLLGDAREQPLLTKLAAAEPARTAAECKQLGCEDAAALTKERVATLNGFGKVLDAAKTCTGDAGCWLKHVEKSDALLMERAALEVGRSGTADHAVTLAARLNERDTEARLALIQSVDWLVEGKPDAAKKVREAALTKLRQQLKDEAGVTQFAAVNEDLRRLALRLERT